MPNHVKNVLTFKKLKPEDKEYILSNYTSIKEDGVYPLDNYIDFDKIIPEPKTEDECPEDCKVNKDSHIMEYEDRPWFDWYTWHNKYWGTKWNAYDGYIIVKPTSITFVFNTAWNPPHPIYEELSGSDCYFEVRWADECIGGNCGKIICDPIEDTYDMFTSAHHTLNNPYQFAKRLWDKY